MEGESGDDTVRLRPAGRSDPHPTRQPPEGKPPGTAAAEPARRPSRRAAPGRGAEPGRVAAGMTTTAQGWRRAAGFGLAVVLLAFGAGIAAWIASTPRAPEVPPPAPVAEAPPPQPLGTTGPPQLPAGPSAVPEAASPAVRAEAAQPPVRVDAAPPPAQAAPPPGMAQQAESPPPPLLTEAEILALAPEAPRMLRLRENPRVFVLLFPTLEAQGAALNRIAALIEKAGLPRDRLLDDAELAAAIARSGDAAATWYLGHDYNGTDLARFFALAERDGLRLSAEELWVRDRFREARALVPAGEEVALVSTANADARMDPAMRAAILRHEIGHGHFFTLPGVARHVLDVWRHRFAEADRRAFRGFLAREGYDAANETLMANETMAYLVFTPDPRFFAARHVGMAEEEVARLRGLMREGMPLP